LGSLLDDSLKMMKGMAQQIETTGFSILYLILIFFSNFIINSIFGMIGGALGMSFVNRKSRDKGNQQ
jgi:NhaP-type Na+/H+ and K+/H+ antiporter